MNVGRSEFQAGLFLLIALALAAISILTLGKERQIFASQAVYHTSFSDVKGLASGAPLRLGGITVGRVDEIRFGDNLSDPKIHVQMLINEDYLDRIRLGSKVTLQNQGLLGDRFLSLSLSTKGTALPPGSVIPSVEQGDMTEILEKAGTMVNNAADASEDLKVFLKDFRGTGLSDLNESLASLQSISKEIQSGKGLVHNLIYGDNEKDGMGKSLRESTKSLSRILKEIESGDGMLHALVYDRSGRKTVRNLSRAMTEFAKLSEKLGQISDAVISGEGLAHNLIYAKDETSIDDTLASFNKAAKNFEKASQALADGQGTLGALLVDSQLYDNLVEATDGAKRSAILRYAVRKSIEKSREQ